MSDGVIIEKDRFEKWLDKNFEPKFFALRYFTLIPVIFSFLGSLMMFSVGAYETLGALEAIRVFDNTQVQLELIKAVDAFLLGLVLLIFSYGIYDLFVSRLDVAETLDIRPDWIKFKNIGELKTILAEVILIILTISFFELIVANIHQFTDFWTFLVIPIGAFLIALGLGLFIKLTHTSESH